jgi:hypothetical protein
MPLFTLQYVYQLSDFLTTGGNITPPDEQGARAAGSPPFTMTLDPAATPLQAVIDDDDTLFQETTGSDPSQPLASDITIDGVLYPAGSHVVVNYVLTDNNGFEGFSITIGDSNSGNNTTTAFITTQPMVPGQQYVFTQEANIGGSGARSYSEFACFTSATLIETPQGVRKVGDLAVGDLVCTLLHGPQPVRWVGRRSVPGMGAMAPVRICKGTLGATRDLLISPNHRMLISGAHAQLYMASDTVLVAAKHLVNGRTVKRSPTGFVTYVHIMFDDHEIVQTQGCDSESYYVGTPARAGAALEQAAEVLALFPELGIRAPRKLARPEARAYEASLLAQML